MARLLPLALFIAALVWLAIPTSQEAADAPGEWDYYVSRVEDAPASILLNLAYSPTAPLPAYPTLLVLTLSMEAGGPNGLGDTSEMKRVAPLEDAWLHGDSQSRLHYVGRLRNRGRWQWFIYAPSPASASELRERLPTEFRDLVDLESRSDPNWQTFREFLLPDPERRRWMLDREVVDALKARGDAHDVPRPVDHFVYFSDAGLRAQFTASAKALGFETTELPAGEDPGSLGVQAVRTDVVTLDRIHAVVMELTELAERHGGSYDGWGCEVQTRQNAGTTSSNRE